MTNLSKERLAELRERVEDCREFDNGLDIAIDIALFQPDAAYSSVKANDAGTKLVYTRHDGRTETYWARDHTLNDANRKAASTLLSALTQDTP